MPRVNTPSKGPPIMPNSERAACKIQLIIYSIFKTFDINSCGVDMFLISSRVVLCTSHKIMCSFYVTKNIICGVDVFLISLCVVLMCFS